MHPSDVMLILRVKSQSGQIGSHLVTGSLFDNCQKFIRKGLRLHHCCFEVGHCNCLSRLLRIPTISLPNNLKQLIPFGFDENRNARVGCEIHSMSALNARFIQIV